VKAEYLKDMPIPRANAAQERLVTDLVKKILAAKKRDSQADTTELEQEIDHFVYELYGLSKEEIAIVEGSNHG